MWSNYHCQHSYVILLLSPLLFLLLQTDHARYENGRYVYKFQRSPMCDYMVTFIHKLKQLPETYMMNSVLENFSILQVNNSCILPTAK